MRTPENRARYDRSKLRYPTALTDAEWALIALLIPPAKRGGNKRTADMRKVVDSLMYVLDTGCQWRATPPGLGPAQHRLWLLRALGLGRHLGTHPPCASRTVPRAGRARGQPDRDHR